jgi:recombination protein RecA
VIDMPRERFDDDDDQGGGNYFATPQSHLEFISSGAVTLDCALGGGWPLTRIANIIGDESTGKTLLAIEAMRNCLDRWKKAEAFYRESESAWDDPYAEALGLPVDKVRFVDPDKFITVEDFFEDLQYAVDICRRKEVPGIYVCDSLDGLSAKEELAMKFGEASYGTDKAKQMGKLLKQCKLEVAKARMCLVIVSQTRDKIGALAFQKKKTRSGGKALDFYASQCLWLSHLETLNREFTRNGKKIKRPEGIRIKAKCEKNKIALPYQTAEFTIRFGQGIDSLDSSLEWLNEVGELPNILNGSSRTAYNDRVRKMDDDDYWKETLRVGEHVKNIWYEVNEEILSRARRRPAI